MEGYFQTGLLFVDADWAKGTNSGVPVFMDLNTECHQVGDKLSIHRTIGVPQKLLLPSHGFLLTPEHLQPDPNRIRLSGDFIQLEGQDVRHM
jgi:hypothetical protein